MMMLVTVLLLIIIAISLNYFNLITNAVVNNGTINDEPLSNEVNDMVSNTTFWKRITVVLLIISLPLLWEGRFYEEVYIYNGLLLLTNKLNLVVWLLFITGLSLITIASIKDNFTDSILIESGQNERIVFTLCTILGGIILSSATDFLTILLGLELQSYSVYILAASYRNYEPSEAAGLKYFLLGALSSALVFMGLAILYAYSGSTNLDTAFLMLSSGSIMEVADSTDYFALEYNAILPYVGITLILAGISWKVAAAPLQAWSIDVYDAVPTRTTAILSLLPKIALFSLLIRLISMLTNNTNDNTAIVELIGATGLQIIILVIALSLMIGSIAGLFQPRIKRLLAYSSVLNVGFILMGALLTNSTLDYFNPTLYIIQYIITTAAIWLCLINLANISNTSNIYSEVTLISQLQGIHSSSNKKSLLNNKSLNNSVILAVCLTALILSTAGIPPMVGFYAKYSVILLALQSGYTSLALIAVLASIISTVYYLGVIKSIWNSAPVSFNTVVINSMRNTGWEPKAESTLFISFFSLIIVLYLLQYSVAYVLISL